MAATEVCGYAIRLSLAVNADNAVTDEIVSLDDLAAALSKAGLAVQEVVGNGITGSCSVAGDYIVLVQTDGRLPQIAAAEATRLVLDVYNALARGEAA